MKKDLRSKNLNLQLFNDTVMFVIRRNEFHPIRRSCRSDEGISEEEAYLKIRKYSMDNRKSMREVAEAIILAADMKKTKEIKKTNARKAEIT